jgi:serine/threonine protein phosphatase PrpC
MVSRALGDSYLKRRSFAFDRFHKAEYVSCEPEMTLLYAQESLQDVIVMASDGIWDLVSAETIRDCIVDA